MRHNLLLHQLHELVICCDTQARVIYANQMAEQRSIAPLVGRDFRDLLISDAVAKGELFLHAAENADPTQPTAAWELPVGTVDQYELVNFRGYRDDDRIVIIGEPVQAAMASMQHELLALNSELNETQRELRRQNRALQQALNDQKRLLTTINELTAPIVPIWDSVLLLPLVGHIDSHRSQQISEQLLERVSEQQARCVVLDISGISTVDTAVAHQLIQTARALRLLGVKPILVGINPEIAQIIVHLGIHLADFTVYADLQRAIAFVLGRHNRPA